MFTFLILLYAAYSMPQTVCFMLTNTIFEVMRVLLFNLLFGI